MPRPLRSRKTCIALSVTAFVWLATPSGAWAAPAKKSCSQADTFDRLVCRQGAIADQLAYTSDEVFGEGKKLRGSTTEARVKQFRDAKDRARYTEQKHTREHFRKYAKAELRERKGVGGHLVPLAEKDDKNGDGICDYEQQDTSAECAAIEVGPGGALQKCNPGKKNKGGGKDGLECDFVDVIDAAEEVELQVSAAQTEAVYSAAEDELIVVNESLEKLNANPTGELDRVATADYPGACAFPPGQDLTFLQDEVYHLHWSSAAVSALARMASATNLQTLVVVGTGGNSSVVRLLVEIAAGITNVAYAIADEELKKAGRGSQNPIKDCLSQLALGSSSTTDTVAILQSTVTALQTQLQDLRSANQAQHQQIIARDDENRAKTIERVEEARWDLIFLLNTPQGQRPDFPVK